MKPTAALKTIRTAREAKGLTREQLAKKLDLSAPYVAGIEGGSLAHLISERVEGAIKKTLGNVLAPTLVQSHNAKVRKYRKARATFNKKPARPKATKVDERQLELGVPTFTEFNAKVVADAVKKVEARAAKREAPKTFQGVLPNFLGNLNNARIEELVAEKIFNAIATKIDESLEATFGGKKHG